MRDSLFIISHLFEFVKYFFNFFQILFSMCPSSFLALGLFVSLGENVSLGESFYIISYTTALVKPFFCFWITAQRHGISCQILSAKCIIKKCFLFQLYLPYIYFYKTQLKSFTVFSLSSAAFLIFLSAPTWAWVIAPHLRRRFYPRYHLRLYSGRQV